MRRTAVVGGAMLSLTMGVSAQVSSSRMIMYFMPGVVLSALFLNQLFVERLDPPRQHQGIILRGDKMVAVLSQAAGLFGMIQRLVQAPVKFILVLNAEEVTVLAFPDE